MVVILHRSLARPFAMQLLGAEVESKASWVAGVVLLVERLARLALLVEGLPTWALVDGLPTSVVHDFAILPLDGQHARLASEGMAMLVGEVLVGEVLE